MTRKPSALARKAVAVPIYQTAAYAFDSAQHGADTKQEGDGRFRLARHRHALTRSQRRNQVLPQAHATDGFAVTLQEQHGLPTTITGVSRNKLFGGFSGIV